MRYLFENLESTATKNTKKAILRYFPRRGFYFITKNLNSNVVAFIKRYGNDENAAENVNPNWTTLDYLEYLLRDTFFHGKASQKFEPGAARIAILECKWDPIIDKEFNNYDRIEELRNILEYITEHDYDKFDQNLNNLSFYDLVDMYKDILTMNKKEKVIEKTRDPENKYIIQEITSFEESQKFHAYTNPASRWCLTRDYGMYKMYTAGGKNRMYFCYLPNFKEIEPNPGDNKPLDTYGLSLICIIVNPRGNLRAGVTRWNHDNGGGDETISKELAEKLLGVKDLSEVCPPNENGYLSYKTAVNEHNKLAKLICDIVKNDPKTLKFGVFIYDAITRYLRTNPEADDLKFVFDSFNVNPIKTKNNKQTNFISIRTDYNSYVEPDNDDDGEPTVESEYHEIYSSILNLDTNKICATNLLECANNTDALGNLVVTRSDGLMNIINHNGEYILNRFVEKVYGYNDKYTCYVDNDKVYILNKNYKLLNKNGIGLEHGLPLNDTSVKDRINSYGDYIIFDNTMSHGYISYIYNVPRNTFTEISHRSKLLSSKVLYSHGKKERSFINLVDNSVIYKGNVNVTYLMDSSDRYVIISSYLENGNTETVIIDTNTPELITKNPIISKVGPHILDNISICYYYNHEVFIYLFETHKTKILAKYGKYSPSISKGHFINGTYCMRIVYDYESKYFNYYGEEVDKETAKPIHNESYIHNFAAYLLGDD